MNEGGRLTGPYFTDLIYSDDQRGTLRRLYEAVGKPSEDGWNVLTTAVMYVAWLVYQETGEPMPSDINEVGEDSLDFLHEQLAQLG
ncbi:Imm6 family immunity protein [Rhizobium leguminosarum]|uniref:Imm6 family immunity protein n=1 Tax=Rhizobium leguminosarum TaxID=384 RepID=UPI003F99AEE4